MDVQKAFYGSSAEICIYHVREQVGLLHQLHDYSKSLTEYLSQMMHYLILDGRNLYLAVAGFAQTLQRAGQDASGVMTDLDEVIDRINSLESVLQKRADVECVIDRGTMEETYYVESFAWHRRTGRTGRYAGACGGLRRRCVGACGFAGNDSFLWGDRTGTRRAF